MTNLNIDQSDQFPEVDKVESMPCWNPCPPFFDFCNNSFAEGIRRFDCSQCFEKFELKDYIE
uniref:Uncharacterized protein n=1 Tax=viral metagenome TaxID=1070528 RepID=A0A6M3LMD6_9ZZZZ